MQKLRALAEQEDGFVSILNLMAMLGILLGITAVANIALVTRDKLESQNAADAIAQASATHMARGMNAITSANHTIGELQAIVVLHHAYGGDNLERGGGDITPRSLKNNLETAFQGADWISPGEYKPNRAKYHDLSRQVRSEAALGDAFLQLKRSAVTAYVVHAVGGAMYWWPYTRPAGIAIMRGAIAYVRLLHREWRILKGAESIARTSLMADKKRVRDRYLPAIYQYSLAQRQTTPDRMENAAQQTGDFHHVDGSLFPGRRRNPSLPTLKLPVRKEPQQISSGRMWRSQLVQASTPWIQYWRQPVLSRSQWTLPLSGFAKHYHKHTQEMSLSLAQRAKQRQGIHLLVMDDHTIHNGQKGSEEWTREDGSRRADELFAVIGFAQRAPPPMIGPGIYVSGVRDRLVTFAQAMIYNANSVQTSDGNSGQWQSVTGWDTLNWVHGRIPEWQYGRSFGRAAGFDKHPKVRLNWQSLLVPTTRLSESVPWQRGAMGQVLDRTEVGLPISRMH